MGWSESQVICKKHQNNLNKNLHGGVCPFCLGERLSQLSTTSTTSTTSPTYVVASSSSSSPDPPRHHRHVSEIKSSISMNLNSRDYGLKKSRSLAFATNTSVGKKRKGFWSKLLHLHY